MSEENVWADDRIGGRAEYAKHWTAYLTKRAAVADSAVVVAVDAPWGAGKTFFVQRWAQQLRAHHPVLRFDAWKNDHIAEPLVAFMSELMAEIERLKKEHSLSPEIKKAVAAHSKKIIQSAGKAVGPALLVVGKGLVKKVSGVDVDEVVAAAEGGTLVSDAMDGIADAVDTEKTLSTFFDKAMAAYKERGSAVTQLQAGLTNLLDALDRHPALKRPMFIFVDEIDRCKPDFALRLLEDVKHVLAAQGVVFVVSVNLEQLAESVRGVYGGGFDGYSYLQRFFESQWTLPPPPAQVYADLLVKATTATPPIYDGIFHLHDERLLARAFSACTRFFGLTLRQQEQVFRSSMLAAQFVRDPVHAHWLFYLTGLKYKQSQFFDRLSLGHISSADTRLVADAVAVPDVDVIVVIADQSHSVRLADLISHYYTVAAMNNREVHEAASAIALITNVEHAILKAALLDDYDDDLDRRGASVYYKYVDAVAACGPVFLR